MACFNTGIGNDFYDASYVLACCSKFFYLDIKKYHMIIYMSF
jgi:hypothetical protein